MTADADLLLRQARILAQREAELAALRWQHERVLMWWNTLHTLARELGATPDVSAVCERWCAILIDDLEFQAAAILHLRADTITCGAWPEHLGAVPPPISDPALVHALRTRGRGRHNDPADLGAAIAAATRIERFVWCTLAPQPDVELLALAGFDARASRFREPFSDADEVQFQRVTEHLSAVLRGALLIQTAAQHERVQQMLATVAAQRAELEQRLTTITSQAAIIRRLSAPVLEIWDGVLVLPLIGELDRARGDDILTALLGRVTATRARSLILDVTGCEAIDADAAAWILRVARAVALLGARCVLTGVRPKIAQGLVATGVPFAEIRVFQDLRAGLRHCVESPA